MPIIFQAKLTDLRPQLFRQPGFKRLSLKKLGLRRSNCLKQLDAGKG